MYLIVSICVGLGLASVTIGYPADHREDTVLPFSLSPGNVNLEKYYLEKYPKPNSPPVPTVINLPLQPSLGSEDENMFLDNEDFDFVGREKRSPQHHHHGGHYGGHHGFHHYPSYGHHHGHYNYYNPYNNYYQRPYNPYHHHHHHHHGR